MKALPDWNDNAAVEAWTNEKLDMLLEWDDRFFRRHRDEIYDSLPEAWREIEIARGAPRGIPPEDFARAWNDPAYVPPKAGPDIEPLRKRYPHLAELLHLPPRIKGQRKKRVAENYDLDHAVEDVKRIRAIWKVKFGRSQRRGLWSAEEIAARRWTRPDPDDTFEERLAAMRDRLHNALHPGSPKPIGSRRKSAPHRG